jgi:hypothetical protein
MNLRILRTMLRSPRVLPIQVDAVKVVRVADFWDFFTYKTKILSLSPQDLVI